MRGKKGSKHAAGSVIELPSRAKLGGRDNSELSSDLEAGLGSSSSKASRAEPPLRNDAADTYGSPNYLGPYTAHGTTAGHDHMRQGRPRNRPPRPLPRGGGVFQRDMICGVRRQMFWVIMATGTFALILTIVIGIGLGVALHRDYETEGA